METYPIKFFLLNKNELTYEVLIRGEEPAPTVLGLRKQINKLTPIIPTSDICESGIDPELDIAAANTSLSELISRVKILEEKYDLNLFERTKALCNHLYHRIKRMDYSDAKYSEKYKSLSKSLSSLINKINYIGRSANPTTSCESVVNSQAVAESVSNLSIYCDHTHLNELQKIKYNGKSCVHGFIQRVSEYSSARNISSTKLLSYATELFTDDALHWYRSIKSSVNTWEELVALLTEDFSHFDHDYRLLSEIRNRTQGVNENITIYIAKMTELFSRLTKSISEQEKLDILKHNIRPCYFSVLASNSSSINNIENLKTLCRNYEKIKDLTSQFREPPEVSSDTLAPDLAYSKFSDLHINKFNYYHQNKYNKHRTYNNDTYNKYKYKNQHNNSSNYNHKYSSKIYAISTSNRKQNYCPRCRNFEHSLSQCKADRFPICFKCGTKNVKYPDCTKCHLKQNAKN